MQDKKHVLVAWSGGLDSTYMIQQYLERGYEVNYVTSKIANSSPAQTKREQQAMSKMLKGYFSDKPVRRVGEVEMTFGGGVAFRHIYLCQPGMWLLSLLNYIEPHHTEVAVGYVMNDDALSFCSTKSTRSLRS